MHLLERYALSSGAKIDKPFILESFYALPFEKYITLHPNSQFNSKNYDYWSAVIKIISPILKAHGIDIVQIGAEHDPELPQCLRVSGQTSINQTAYIIKNSMLHLGADSFPAHVASSYGKKIVALYGNAYSRNAYPYWSEEGDVRLLEPARNHLKPSFSPDESPKSINSISPEKIAKSVLELLEIKHDINQETLFNGTLFSPDRTVYETTLEDVVDAQSMDLEKILCRLDFNHDEKILEQQLQVGPCELIADKIINTEILEKHKHNIIGIIYHINKNDNPDFAKRVMELGISIALVTELSEGEIQPKKINYMDLGLVREIKHPKPKEKELKDVNLNKLFYKSNKITISMGKFYPSKWAWENNLDIGTKDELSKVPDHKTFWKECNNFCFVLETP